MRNEGVPLAVRKMTLAFKRRPSEGTEERTSSTVRKIGWQKER